ncbi:MAG: MFS transporter [Candidatus Binatia bacterium]
MDRIFRSLLHKNYALFWSSDLIASLGHSIEEIALYWMAYEITGSAMALGVLGLCEAAPRLALGAFGGALADRYNRLRLLITVQFLSAIPIFALALLYFLGVLEFWHILTLVLFWASFRSGSPSASQSLLREIIPDSEIMNAVSLYTMGFNFARVIGPSLGGMLILWIGVGGCFLLYGVSLLTSGLIMFLIRTPRREAGRPGRTLLQEIGEGFQYIRRTPMILGSIGAAYVISVFLGTYQRFLPVFAKEVLRVGPRGLGAMMAAPAAGAILFLLFLASAGDRIRSKILLWATTLLAPGFLILFCFSRSFLLSVGLLVFVGGAHTAFRTISRVIIQLNAPIDLLGRVMSVFVMDQGMRSVGSLVIGAFVTLFGPPLGITFTSVTSLILTSALLLKLLGGGQRAW